MQRLSITQQRSTILALALVGTAAAFAVGAQAGALLNGRVMAASVARVPMVLFSMPSVSPATGHVR